MGQNPAYPDGALAARLEGEVTIALVDAKPVETAGAATMSFHLKQAPPELFLIPSQGYDY
jgi:hypothetical protein